MRNHGVPRKVAHAVKSRLGPVYDDLLAVMLDLGVPPIFLFSDDRARLVGVRRNAVEGIHEWVRTDPRVLDLVDLLPEVMQLNDVVASLLEAVTWTDYFDTEMSAFANPSAGDRVFRETPDLLDRIDDDGLLVVADLDARPHGLVYADFSLHYHQFLRRGFASNIHYELIGTILTIAERNGVEARLAVDAKRLRYRSEHEEFVERDYWYGPSLSAAVLDDPFLVGETVHGDPAGGTSFLNPYVATSFRWTADGDLKTIEIEEMVPVDDDQGDLVLVRYLHAIRDTSRKAFIHCDGAVKAYAREGYPRVAGQFAFRGKSSKYRKVFRIDGEIETDEWSHVVALWFRGNNLVVEYLSSLGSGRGTA